MLVALVTARVVATDLSALHRRARSLGRDVPVVLAARDLPLGTTIAAPDIRVVLRPTSTVPPDALHNASDAVGHIVTRERALDDVLHRATVATAQRAGLDAIVPPGRRAMHILVKDGFRPPLGAIVDVLAASDSAVASPGRSPGVATTVAKAARVLAVDDAAVGSGAAAGAGVTVLVAESETGDLADASLNGQLTIALAPPETACCTPYGSSSTP